MKLDKQIESLIDGKKLIIRSAELNDASELIALKKEYIKDSKTIPLFENEYTNSVIDEELLIQHFLSSDNSILLVAILDDKLIGNIDLSGNQRKKMYHTGMIGMGILPEYRNMKIGSLLMKTVMDFTNNIPLLSIVWLEVYATNKAGLKLYKKFGFSVCGTIKNFFIEDGLSIDKIQMVNYLKQ